jgi:hypothetical protein
MGELKGWRDKSESSLRVRFTMSWREVIAERALSEATRIGGCSLRLLVWHWGSEQFREYLLKKVDAAAIRRNRNYQSAQMGRDHGQAEAEKIAQQGLESFGLSESDLKSWPGSDPRKVAIAGFIHQSTTTPQGSNFTLAAAASFAHCQNFSAAGLSRPFDAAMPIEIGFGSGVRRKSFTRFPKL